MSETPSRRRSRMNRAENAQHLYTSRSALDPAQVSVQAQRYSAEASVYQPNEPEYDETDYTPNEPSARRAYGRSAYTPNEPYEPENAFEPNEAPLETAGYQPNEEAASQNAAYAVYFSREGAETVQEAEPAFAPPPDMRRFVSDWQDWEEQENDDAYASEAENVYHPRQVTWAEEDREEAIAESELGYQVKEESKPGRRKKKHTLRTLLILFLLLLLLGGAVWLFWEPIAEQLGIAAFVQEPTAAPQTVSATPRPVSAYDAAPAASVSAAARHTIAQLSGTLEMENYTVTDQHIVTRNQRPDGSYDFYLFSAEGRLLCYFEGLSALDMIPQDFGGFYVSQAPWLLTAGGAALIRTSDIEAAIHEKVFLHPMYRGWAVVESEADGHANYVNPEGELLSSLWFSRTFPFTGRHTLAYVDTGATAAADERYLLYVISDDGTMTRWFSSDRTEDAVAAVCGMAYMSDGSLYRLPETAAALCQSPEVTAYLNCSALVVRDPVSGKYGLFVNGEKHYDFIYDSIQPLQSDLVWAEKTMGSAAALLRIKTVSSASYPQPLSYSFVLEKDGGREYVALSAQTTYPIRLEGEF